MRRLTFILTIFALTAMIGAGPLQAASLNELRASGAIGERYDGYTVLRQSAPGATEIIALVNSERRKIYQQRAAQQNVSAAAVGAVYAKQIFANAPPGTWFQSADGAWRRK